MSPEIIGLIKDIEARQLAGKKIPVATYQRFMELEMAGVESYTIILDLKKPALLVEYVSYVGMQVRLMGIIGASSSRNRERLKALLGTKTWEMYYEENKSTTGSGDSHFKNFLEKLASSDVMSPVNLFGLPKPTKTKTYFGLPGLPLDGAPKGHHRIDSPVGKFFQGVNQRLLQSLAAHVSP
jgi:hypothetical protein